MKMTYLLCLLSTMTMAQNLWADGFTLKEISSFKPEVDFGQQTSDVNSITHVTRPTLSPDKKDVVFTVGSGKGSKVYMFDSSGKIVWTYPSEKDQFLNQWIKSTVITRSGVVVGGTSFGSLIYLNAKTGKPVRTSQISDPDGTTIPQDNRGPFEDISLAQDKETVIIPSNSGKIQFVKDGKVVSTTKIDCKKESSTSSKTCYFWYPIVVRNDGVLIASESNRLIYFKTDGTIINSFVADRALSTLSEDGNTVVSAYHFYEKPNFKSGIVVSNVSAGDRFYTLDEGLDVTFASPGPNNSAVFAAKQQGKDYGDKTKHIVGILDSNNKASLTYMPDSETRGDSLSSIYAPPATDKQGRIFAVGLNGRVYGLDSSGVLRDAVKIQGEPREAPVVTADGTVVVASGGTIYFGNSVVAFYKPTPGIRANFAETQKPKVKFAEIILDQGINKKLWSLFADSPIFSEDKSIEERGIEGVNCQRRFLEEIGLFTSCGLDEKAWTRDAAGGHAFVAQGPLAQNLFDRISGALPNNVVKTGATTLAVVNGADRSLFSCQETSGAYLCRFDKFNP